VPAEELGDAAICRWMGWSWPDLLATPDQVVADVRAWMAKEGALAREREAINEAKGRG